MAREAAEHGSRAKYGARRAECPRRNAAGTWIDTPPDPGSFVVNIGDMFAMWTNDLYVSTLHRVMNFNDATRLSIAFFTYAHGLTEIRCLETCVGPNNLPRYEPVRAEDYDRRLVEQAQRTGRPGLAARTIERLGGPAGR
jgi:isopenicillin N synthase-like dioxygenase